MKIVELGLGHVKAVNILVVAGLVSRRKDQGAIEPVGKVSIPKRVDTGRHLAVDQEFSYR